MLTLSIFLKIFIPVFIVVIYPGPCVLSYGNIAMNYGYKKGYACVLGCYTVELFYWLVGIFALNTAQSLLPETAVNVITIFAGLFLMYIAYDFFRTDVSKLDVSNIKNKSISLYAKFLLLTLSNPIAIVGYAGIYIGIENIKEHIFVVLLTSTLASWTAHSIVVLCSGTIGKFVLKNKNSGTKIMRIVNIVSALCISGYAIFSIFIPVITKMIKG